jgi:quinoprotein glucose dehydrogenase
MKTLKPFCNLRLLIFITACGLPTICQSQTTTDVGWPNYGNDPGGSRYSPITQIDRTNVTKLQVAWTFRTGALNIETDLNHKVTFEVTPILVEGKLFLSTVRPRHRAKSANRGKAVGVRPSRFTATRFLRSHLARGGSLARSTR